jgi:hypothetical protein
MEPLSIDSVVEDHANEMSSSPPRTPPSEAIVIEKPRLKGRQRLLNGLQRMGSSPSLNGLSRPRSHSLWKGIHVLRLAGITKLALWQLIRQLIVVGAVQWLFHGTDIGRQQPARQSILGREDSFADANA